MESVLESRATRREYVGAIDRRNRLLETYRSYELRTKRKSKEDARGPRCLEKQKTDTQQSPARVFPSDV